MRLFSHTFQAMGGLCALQVAAPGAAEARHWCALAEQEVRRIETRYSRYRPDSVVARINAAAGAAWVVCDGETRALLDFADQLHGHSDGLFDITSGVLRRVWRFDAACPPTDEALAAVLPLIGWGQVLREGDRVRLAQPGMELDFGGFGKEYAADRVADLWQAEGVAHGLVNLAGDVRLRGSRPDGQAWSLGVRHPRREGALLATLALHDGALATSGDYERFLEQGGQRHCHILHPRTGRSVTHWQSISVVAPQAVMAGGLSTIAMLKGPDALRWLDAAGVDYLAVDASGRLHGSSAAAPSPCV
ncbi:MAG: FAD:protein FMN transferase [Burkholderiaceae bacterium]|nr:FAD:protein FMN transferase [Burkholderiaceae bacterium]